LSLPVQWLMAEVTNQGGYPEPAPAVSVIVPTRDRPEMLERALASISRQTMQDWECVVVNDGAAGSVTLPDDSRFRLLDHDRPHGPSAARNSGLRAARGEYVAFLDDDDELTPDALRVLRSAAAPGLIAFGQTADLVSGHVAGPLRPLPASVGGAIIDDPPHHSAGLYHRGTCVEYDEALRTGEDVEWLLRMGLSHQVTTVPVVCHLRRRHEGPRPGIERRTRLSGRLMLIAKHGAWFGDHPRSHARQLARCASAAYLADENALAVKLALRSLRLRRSRLALAVLARAAPRAVVARPVHE
jgi:glycosyltransferase involved in cell wall biosynthesis